VHPIVFIEVAMLLASGFLVTFVSLPRIMDYMIGKGIVGRDVHKREKPIIPEMGGVAVLLGLSVCSIIGIYLFPRKALLFVSFLATALIAGVIGAIDDIVTLNARVKPFLMTFACIPILILGTYTPSIVFPYIGGARLTRIYPLLIPIVMAVTSNGVNMMDPFNGTMSGSCSFLVFFLFLSAILLGRGDGVLLTATLLGPLLAFFWFNKYPSKVFSGDVGSLSIGAAIGAIAILGRLEVVAIVAFMPQIMNAFYGLSTIGRLYERREVARPVTVLDDGRLMATSDPKAPLTLARFVLARGPLFESQAANVIVVLSAISGALALITAYLTVLTT
jgi:UDP-N-acetylglucosamine--dolichyl-phosphate N-acetylglucosaminephosphotransferase